MRSSPWMSQMCLWITTYCFTWALLYNILRTCLFCKEPSTFSARLVASIHALTVTSLAYPIWKDDMKMVITPGTFITEKQADVLAAILGYIIFDYIWCLSNNCEPFIMKAHHSISILLIVLALTKANSGAELIYIYGFNQVTNLFLQLRWFLRCHGFSNESVEILFIISFFVERIWLTSTLFMNILNSSAVHNEFKACLICHGVIGYIFSYHVALMVLTKVDRAFNGTTQKKSSDHSILSFEQYEDQEEEVKIGDIGPREDKVDSDDATSQVDSDMICRCDR